MSKAFVSCEDEGCLVAISHQDRDSVARTQSSVKGLVLGAVEPAVVLVCEVAAEDFDLVYLERWITTAPPSGFWIPNGNDGGLNQSDATEDVFDSCLQICAGVRGHGHDVNFPWVHRNR